jgi:hypothetical protein
MSVLFLLFPRRARDSNPRTCNSQQFSRLPQSTTLPALRGKSKGSNFVEQKIVTSFLFFLLQRILYEDVRI